MFVIPEGGERLHMAYMDVAPEGDSNGRTGLLLHGRNFPWKLIKPKVLNQPGNDPGIVADAHFRLNRFLPVLDKQLEGRDYVIGPLSVVDFLIAPRFDSAPALLGIDISPYKNIDAWLARLRARPYWQDA